MSRDLSEAFGDLADALGMTGEARRVFVEGRDGPLPSDPFDARVAVFRQAGLSESAARVAAIGRAGSEHEARRELAEAVGAPPSADVHAAVAELADAYMTFHGISRPAAGLRAKAEAARVAVMLEEGARSDQAHRAAIAQSLRQLARALSTPTRRAPLRESRELNG